MRWAFVAVVSVVSALACALDACGGSVDATTSDASTDAASDGPLGTTLDASPAIEASAGFDSSAFVDAGNLDLADGSCTPPCADGEYCYARVNGGGGRRKLPLDPIDGGGDASTPGCHAIPTACATTPTCACLVAAVGPECHASTVDCIVDDAGRPTVECIFVFP